MVLRNHRGPTKVPQMFHTAIIPTGAVRPPTISPSSWWEGL